jgi:hypothetical protein
MATDLKTSSEAFTLTRFWGGEERQQCVQVTVPACKDSRRDGQFFDFVQLTREQARALAQDLQAFADSREEEQW